MCIRDRCNDSYSLAVIALKLKEIFELNDINELPIIYNIAWYEQKAVIVLLALLSLGVKNIHLGPTLPAFLSPNVTKLLIENFQISGIDTVEHDMRLFFGEYSVSLTVRECKKSAELFFALHFFLSFYSVSYNFNSWYCTCSSSACVISAIRLTSPIRITPQRRLFRK